MNSWPAEQVAAQLGLQNIRAPLSGGGTKSPQKWCAWFPDFMLHEIKCAVLR